MIQLYMHEDPEHFQLDLKIMVSEVLEMGTESDIAAMWVLDESLSWRPRWVSQDNVQGPVPPNIMIFAGFCKPAR